MPSSTPRESGAHSRGLPIAAQIHLSPFADPAEIICAERMSRAKPFHPLLCFLPFDRFGLVRALRDMDEESIRALQPNFGQQVVRHIFRI